MIYVHLFLTILQKRISFTVGRAFLILSIVVLLFVFIKFPSTKQETISQNLPKLDSVTNIIGKDGKVHAQVEEKLLSKKEMKHVIDSVSKALKVNSITHGTSLVNSLNVFVKSDTVYIDTASGKVFSEYKDRFIYTSFLGNYKLNTGAFNIKLTPDTITMFSTRTSRFLRSDLNKLDIVHTNDSVKTVMASYFDFKEPKSIIVIGPYIGWDLLRNKPSIGVSATFNLLSIKSK